MSETRKCKHHGEQPLSDWKKYTDKNGYVKYTCKLCHKKSDQKHTLSRRGRYGLLCQASKDKFNTNARVRVAKNRLTVLQHYSGSEQPFCACCKDSHLEFLALDHMFGGGSKHRKEIGSHATFRWVKKNNYPPIFQVLCHNCNMARAFYGSCPHETEQTTNNPIEETRGSV